MKVKGIEFSDIEYKLLKDETITLEYLHRYFDYKYSKEFLGDLRKYINSTSDSDNVSDNDNVSKEVKEDKPNSNKVREYANWTDEEIEYLKENHKKLAVNELSKHLNRTHGSIAGKINFLGLNSKRLSNKDYVLIADFDKAAAEVAKIISRDKSTVYKYRKELLDKNDSFSHPFPRKTLKFLADDNYSSYKLNKMFKKYGDYSYTYIIKKHLELFPNLDLSEFNRNNRWSSEDDNFLLNNYNKLSVTQIAKTLNRTESAVLKRFNKLSKTNPTVLDLNEFKSDEFKSITKEDDNQIQVKSNLKNYNKELSNEEQSFEVTNSEDQIQINLPKPENTKRINISIEFE